MANWKDKILDGDIRGRVPTVAFIESLLQRERVKTALYLIGFEALMIVIGYIIFFVLI